MEHLSNEWDAQSESLKNALSAVRSACAALPKRLEDLLADLEWVEESLSRELEALAPAGESVVGEDFYTPKDYCA